MSSTVRDPAGRHADDDTFLRIAIDPALPCGIDGCGLLTHWGQVERDPRFVSLWCLLPLCEGHQVRLAAGLLESLGRPRVTDD